MMTEARKGLPVRTTELSLVRRLGGEVIMTEEEWVLLKARTDQGHIVFFVAIGMPTQSSANGMGDYLLIQRQQIQCLCKIN